MFGCSRMLIAYPNKQKVKIYALIMCKIMKTIHTTYKLLLNIHV